MTKIKYLQPNEKLELWDVIKKDQSIHARRNLAIFSLAEYCALRASEIGKIRIEYLRRTDSHTQIYCERLKGSFNNTLLIIEDEIEDILYDYYYHERLCFSSSSPFLFLSQKGAPISRKTLDAIMKKYCEKTSIPKEKHHFHVLRHTRAVELADEGLNLQAIQWWLGHKNVCNTMIYTQFTVTQQRHIYRYLLKRRAYEERTQEKYQDQCNIR